MVAPVDTGAIPEVPESAQDALRAAPLVLPEQGNVIHIKMAKKHPLADVIHAVGHLMLFVASSAITFLYAKRQIDEGSAFGPIQAALNIISGMQKK